MGFTTNQGLEARLIKDKYSRGIKNYISRTKTIGKVRLMLTQSAAVFRRMTDSEMCNSVNRGRGSMLTAQTGFIHTIPPLYMLPVSKLPEVYPKGKFALSAMSKLWLKSDIWELCYNLDGSVNFSNVEFLGEYGLQVLDGKIHYRANNFGAFSPPKTRAGIELMLMQLTRIVESGHKTDKAGPRKHLTRGIVSLPLLINLDGTVNKANRKYITIWLQNERSFLLNVNMALRLPISKDVDRYLEGLISSMQDAIAWVNNLDSFIANIDEYPTSLVQQLGVEEYRRIMKESAIISNEERVG